MELCINHIRSMESYNRMLDALKNDVKCHGGTCAQTVDIHGELWKITVSNSSWGLIVIRKPISRLEAIADMLEFDPFL